MSSSRDWHGNRDYYLDAENADKREGYVKWLTEAFTLCGMENPAEAAASVLAFETKMAEAFRSNVELRDIASNYNPMSRADFVKRYDAIDWDVYFKGMGIGDFETLIVGQPATLDAVNALVKSESPATIGTYLVANYLSSAAPYLSDDIYPKIPGILKQMTPYATLTAPLLSAKIPKSKKVFDNSKVTDHHAIIPTGQNPAQLIGLDGSYTTS